MLKIKSNTNEFTIIFSEKIGKKINAEKFSVPALSFFLFFCFSPLSCFCSAPLFLFLFSALLFQPSFLFLFSATFLVSVQRSFLFLFSAPFLVSVQCPFFFLLFQHSFLFKHLFSFCSANFQGQKYSL